MKIIDISVSVGKDTPLWPKALAPQFSKELSIEKGDTCNDSSLRIGLHTGTHIDAPLHFIKDGKSVEELPLDIFVGPALVVFLPDVKEITAENIEKLNIPENTERILFKTSNSNVWGTTSEFTKDYVGISVTGAEWLSKRNIKLIGVDYLSIAKFDEAVEVHRILLGKGIVLLEGINLSNVEAGMYTLSCLPIKYSDAEAAPVRAVLMDLT